MGDYAGERVAKRSREGEAEDCVDYKIAGLKGAREVSCEGDGEVEELGF